MYPRAKERKDMADKYECTLDETSLKKAAKELHEDPKERENAVATFRQWIEQNSSWLKTPTDTKFLLSFLRNAKFVQLAARKRLVNYWVGRTKNKKWFDNVDTFDEKTVAVLKRGSFMPLKNKDKEGRVVILGKPAAVDVAGGDQAVDDVMKAINIVMDYCLMDESVQVNGFVMVMDMGDLTFKHQKFYGIDVMKRSMKVWMKAYPARYKAIHYYNTNPIFDAIFAICSPLMPDKLKQRLTFHGKKLFEMYDYVEKSCLPREYLPDNYTGENIGLIQDCIDYQLNVLQDPAVRDHLLHLSSVEYGVNETLKPSDEELFNESFRKLNVN